MSLATLTWGCDAVIEHLHVGASDAALLRAMGLAPGERVRVLRVAPFGGPYQVRVGTMAFALDRALAHSVAVRALDPAAE